MDSFDYKSNAVSKPSIVGTTVMATSLTGTAVDLAGALGAVAVFTFGSSPAGTAVVAPFLHDSNDASTWGTAATADVQGAHGTLVGTTSVAGTGRTVALGYTGSKRYVRAFVQAGGPLQGGTAVGGTANQPGVGASVLTFTRGYGPVTGG